MQIDHLDHLVLTVQDIQATCEFYARVLGMQVVSLLRGARRCTSGIRKSISIRRGKKSSQRLSIRLQALPTSARLPSMPLEHVIAHLQSCHVSLLLGPVEQTGATRPLVSIYFRDPDGNLLARLTCALIALVDQRGCVSVVKGPPRAGPCGQGRSCASAVLPF